MFLIPQKLFTIIDNLKKLGSAEYLNGLNTIIAEDELKNIQYRFDTATDPTGKAWQPRKEQGDGHPLLNKSGLMKRSFRIKEGKAFSIINTTTYASYHQFGTSRIPARQFLLNNAPGLSAKAIQLFYGYTRGFILSGK